MKSLSLFKEARQLLQLAEETAIAVENRKNTSSIFLRGSMNKTELQEFAKKYKFIIERLIDADNYGQVSYDEGNTVSWRTGFTTPYGESHYINLIFMPCVGSNCGIIRVIDMTIENAAFKNGVVYMVIVNGRYVKIQKYLGWKVQAENASPDWVFEN